MKAIIGKKIGMTRIFDDMGNVVPVTLIMADNCVVTQIKTEEKDKYNSVQIGIDDDKKINKPLVGHLSKAKIKTRTLKEFSLGGDLKVSDKIDLSQFEVGDIVSLSSVSKGKGFAGTVKRHHFHLGPKTHGSNNYRQPGSIGSMYPQRVIKGRRMAGHLGHDQVTLKSVKIVNIDNEKNILLVRGAVPGPNKSIVYIWKNND